MLWKQVNSLTNQLKKTPSFLTIERRAQIVLEENSHIINFYVNSLSDLLYLGQIYT